MSDRQAWANSVDSDEMQQNMASHQGSTVFATHPAFVTQHLLVEILEQVR